MRKRTAFEQRMVGQPGIHMEKNKVGSFFIPDTKIIPKWITDLNVRYKTKIVLEENARIHFVALD